MNTEITIRSLQPQDKAGWCALWRAYHVFYEFEPPADLYGTTFARLLCDEPSEFSVLVAESHGCLVGLAHYLFHRHCWYKDNVCYLQDLFTAKEARSQGVARALIKAVGDVAHKQGAPHVYWLTQEFNKQARYLYDKVAAKTPFVQYKMEL